MSHSEELTHLLCCLSTSVYVQIWMALSCVATNLTVAAGTQTRYQPLGAHRYTVSLLLALHCQLMLRSCALHVTRTMSIYGNNSSFYGLGKFLHAFGASVCKKEQFVKILLKWMISPAQAAVLIPLLVKIAATPGSPMDAAAGQELPYTPSSSMLTSSNLGSSSGTPLCPQFGYESEESSGFSSELLSKKFTPLWGSKVYACKFNMLKLVIKINSHRT